MAALELAERRLSNSQCRRHHQMHHISLQKIEKATIRLEHSNLSPSCLGFNWSLTLTWRGRWERKPRSLGRGWGSRWWPCQNRRWMYAESATRRLPPLQSRSGSPARRAQTLASLAHTCSLDCRNTRWPSSRILSKRTSRHGTCSSTSCRCLRLRPSAS